MMRCYFVDLYLLSPGDQESDSFWTGNSRRVYCACAVTRIDGRVRKEALCFFGPCKRQNNPDLHIRVRPPRLDLISILVTGLIGRDLQVLDHEANLRSSQRECSNLQIHAGHHRACTNSPNTAYPNRRSCELGQPS